MEIYLKKDDTDVFRFPVIPSAFQINGKSILNNTNIHSKGTVTTFGGRELKEIELTSFFPNKNHNYSFVNFTDYLDSYESVKKIRNWQVDGEKLRLIITDTNINMLVLIDDFSWGEQDGTRDVYYSLTLKEYREIKISTDKSTNTSTNSNTNSSSSTSSSDTTNKTSTAKTHKVKKGDTLWAICRKYYGSTSTATITKLRNKNKSKYPSLAKSTVIQIGWVLTL